MNEDLIWALRTAQGVLGYLRQHNISAQQLEAMMAEAKANGHSEIQPDQIQRLLDEGQSLGEELSK